MRCGLCGEAVEPDDADAVQVPGGLMHGECIEEHDEPGLFGAQDPESAANGRDAAAFECSTVELERQRRQAARKRKSA